MTMKRQEPTVSGDPVGQHRSPRQCAPWCLPRGFLRAKFAQALKVFGAQMHFVALFDRHQFHP
jgi:hypothetical protein